MPSATMPSVTLASVDLPRARRFVFACGLLLGTLLATATLAQTMAIGDTLTVIRRPLLNIPALVTPGETLDISCAADPATTGWTAELQHEARTVPLTVTGASYDPATLWWTVSAQIPAVDVYELYDLRVTASGGLDDVTWRAVQVLPEFRDDYYFFHVTDTHLPTHLYYYESGADTDTSEVDDLRSIIEDINVINPEFVLLTGDLVNEGELEDYLNKRYYTRAQRLLAEFEVPVFLTSGNHDIGGWNSTPPPDGTARREWWRFFGWQRLDSPPPGAPEYTQNYSFDYGPVHYVGMESYVNYDDWRWGIYGNESFTSGQLQWLNNDLAAAGGSSSQVLFYHMDFADQLDLGSLGVELALYGHIHYDSGSLSSPPYNLATNNACDGDRAYRLIRVSSGTVSPRPTLEAGASGLNFRVIFTPANDGTNDSVTAQIINGHSERFGNGRLKFHLPNTPGTVQVSGGTLLQTDDSGPVLVCYVAVDIQASSSQSVTASIDPTAAGEDGGLPHALVLGPNHPNPFNPQTELSFAVPRPAHVRLGIFDLRGREVAKPVDGVLEEGWHTARWDGRDRQGQEVPSGVYIARLVVGGQTQARKLVLSR